MFEKYDIMHAGWSTIKSALLVLAGRIWKEPCDCPAPTALTKQSLDGCIHVDGCLCVYHSPTHHFLSQSEPLIMFAFSPQRPIKLLFFYYRASAATAISIRANLSLPNPASFKLAWVKGKNKVGSTTWQGLTFFHFNHVFIHFMYGINMFYKGYGICRELIHRET